MQHPKEERTLVIVKPDGIQRSLIGEIIKRYERMGLKLVGLKLFIPTEAQVEEHYLLDSGWKEGVGKKAIASYEKKGLKPSTTDPIAAGRSKKVPDSRAGSRQCVARGACG